MRAMPRGTLYPLITMSLSVSLHAHMYGGVKNVSVNGDMLPNQAWCMGMMISTLVLALGCQCMMKRGYHNFDS